MRIAVSVGVTVATMAAACGGGADEPKVHLDRASYRVDSIGSFDEIGEVPATNASGQIVSHSVAHGWAVLDLGTRAFTPLPEIETVLDFNAAGDLLYRVSDPDPKPFLRGANGLIRAVPTRLYDAGGFRPVALAEDGGVLGKAQQRYSEALFSGVGRLAPDWDQGTSGDPHLASFRRLDFGTPPWCAGWPSELKGVAADGTAALCELPPASADPDRIRCCRSAPDGSVIELGDLVADRYRVNLLPITPNGRIGGTLTTGVNGVGGTRPALFHLLDTEVLGDREGAVLALNDRNEVVFTQLGSSQPLRVRTTEFAVVDLTDYVRDPGDAAREITGDEVLALLPDGRILVVHGARGAAGTTVDLLTPE